MAERLFCKSCGAVIEGNNHGDFCTYCGAKLIQEEVQENATDLNVQPQAENIEPPQNSPLPPPPPPITSPPPYTQPNEIPPANLKNFKVCTKCKQYIPKKASRCPYCRASQGISCSGMLSALVFVVVAFVIIKVIITKDENHQSWSPQSSPTATPTQSTTYIPPRDEYIAMCETIDYETLSRNPDKYKGQDFQITGEVIQVVESGSGQVDFRINITKGDYFWSDTIYATTIIPTGSDRILEDDTITIYGKCEGLYTYESVLGAQVSLPLITVYYYSIEE